jgi:hypothetical protein
MALGRHFIALPFSYENHALLITPAHTPMPDSNSDIMLWMEEQNLAAKHQYYSTNELRMPPLSSILDTLADNFLRIPTSLFLGCRR